MKYFIAAVLLLSGCVSNATHRKQVSAASVKAYNEGVGAGRGTSDTCEDELRSSQLEATIDRMASNLCRGILTSLATSSEAEAKELLKNIRKSKFAEKD